MKKVLLKGIAFVFWVALTMTAARANDLILANGSSGATIVVGMNATETERYAATELQRCIRIMTGTDLPVVQSDVSVSGAQIIIGTAAGNNMIDEARSRLHLDGADSEQIAVLREGDILYLAGQTPRAALYATYTFLEDVLGVRWLWPGASGEFIPHRNVVAVDALSIFEVPRIQTRAFTNADMTDSETGTWGARNKLNMVAVAKNADGNSPAIKEVLKKGFQTRIAGHFVVLPQSILTAHPEYAALHSGSRSYSSANTAQLCWGNPGVQEEVANMIAGLWASSPFVDIIHFYPADNQTYCTDELCMAMAPDVSTRWQKFSQIVMEKVDQIYPGKRYWTYAYQGYKSVPQAVAPRFESIGYTLYEASYRHLLSSGFSGSAGAIAEIDGWKAKGAKMGIRGYEYIMFRDPMFVPLVSWEMDQMSWLVDKGLTSYLSELRPFGSPSGAPPEDTYWMCNRLNLYAAAKGMWNSEMTADSVVNDWYTTIYGSAASDMIAYYHDIEQLWRDAPGDIHEYTNTPASQVNNFFSEEDFVRLNEYFTRARTKLAGMSADVRDRISAQIDLEERMLGKWHKVYNFANNHADHFETVIERKDTVDQTTWNNALRLPAFEEASGEPASEQTVVSKVWTPTDLYFHIVCQDDDISSRVHNATEDDDGAILTDDCIELYIQPNLSNAAYMHFAVNSAAKKYDAVTPYGGSDFDVAWDADWTATTSIGSDGWTVDVKIPFAALAIEADSSTQFKLAIKRSRGGRAENSGWPDAVYLNPVSFGVATLVTEAGNAAENRVILYDAGGTSSANVSTEFQERGWQVVSGVTGEDELRQKLAEDAAVLLIRHGSTTPLISTDFYLTEIKNYIEKGRVVIISTARDLPIDEWFPGTPAVTWSGNDQHISASKSSFQLPGAWQTYPNNISNEIIRKQNPVSAYIPQAEGWRVLLKMPLKNGSDEPFLLTRRIGDGLLVLTSSNMGYSGGYEVFGSRNITNAVKLTENFRAEQKTFSVVKRDQTILFDNIPPRVLGEDDFEVSAIADSGLPVTLTSDNPAVATITDGIITLTGVGTSVITASQEGDEIYKPAESVSQVLTVVADTVAPGMPEDLSAAVTDSTARLSWLPSTDYIGVVGYRIYKDGNFINVTNLTAFNVTGLNSSVTYEFEVSAIDAAGNESVPAAITVTTPDTQAPATPANLNAVKTTRHRVALDWLPSTDNVAVAGYNVYRNGLQLNEVMLTDTKFIAERPRGKDVYEFTVRALDAAGNISGPSNAAVSANGNIKEGIDTLFSREGDCFMMYPNASGRAFSVNVNSDFDEDGAVSIVIYNRAGFVIRSINDFKSGAYHRELDVKDLSPGTYLIRVTINGVSQARNMIIE